METSSLPSRNQKRIARALVSWGSMGIRRGESSLLMAEDGRYLYAASYGDSAIHIWSRDPGTGRLAWKSTFSDPREDVDLRRGRIGLGPGGYFMRGPRALALGSAAGSNHTLLVACGTSNSGVLLDRNATTGDCHLWMLRVMASATSEFAASAPEAGANARPFPQGSEARVARVRATPTGPRVRMGTDGAGGQTLCDQGPADACSSFLRQQP